MNTIESFPYLIDNILADLEAAARIRIDCQSVDKTNSTEGDILRVTAVNDMISACHFFHYMEHLRVEAMNKLRETLPQIATSDMEAFFDQMLRRVRKISHSVEVNRSSVPTDNHGMTVYWARRSLNCRYHYRNTQEPEVVRAALVNTRRHALTYYLVLKKLEDRIKCCAGAALGIQFTPLTFHGIKQGTKFKLTCSVAFLSAFLRILCDRNLVENPNVSELCRRIAAACCTSRQENLSPHSLRNCFDNPTPEVLENVREELRLCDKYIMNLIRRQRR